MVAVPEGFDGSWRAASSPAGCHDASSEAMMRDHSLGSTLLSLQVQHLLHKILPWRRRAARAPAAVPDGMIVYAIGDIHGERALLDAMLTLIEEDWRGGEEGLEAVVVFLGDYVDRGPDSRGVVERLAGGVLPGAQSHFLMGNHEQAMLRFLQAPAAESAWLQYGGVQTLASYGIAASVGAADAGRCEALAAALRGALPVEHLTFLENLQITAVFGDYAFVHAGVRPGQPLARQRVDDLLWIRQPFLSSRRDHGHRVVHGHTVVDHVELHKNRIAVDTGAYATGRLSAVALDRDRVRVLEARSS